MRSAKDFFRPLAVGAPEPVREIPFRPSRVIHFFPGSNPKMVAKVPDIAPTDHDLHEWAEDTHALLFWTLVVVALVHAAAAIHHHLFLRDATLARMLPGGWLRVDAGEPRTEETRDAA